VRFKPFSSRAAAAALAAGPVPSSCRRRFLGSFRAPGAPAAAAGADLAPLPLPPEHSEAVSDDSVRDELHGSGLLWNICPAARRGEHARGGTAAAPGAEIGGLNARAARHGEQIGEGKIQSVVPKHTGR